MSERRIVITEENGTYQIHNSILNEFELLGLFEQIVFDLKYSRAEKPARETKAKDRQKPEPILPAVEQISASAPEPPVEDEQNSPAKAIAPERINGIISLAATDLRTRISNATKAIRDLGGKVDTTGLIKMSDEELQTELEELTAQYKRLKNTNSKGK